jgi:hypothetical protein
MLGTASKRQHSHPPSTADALADTVLPDSDGHDIRLGGVWQDQPLSAVPAMRGTL